MCTVCQNVKHLLASFPLPDGDITYHVLLDHMVCSTASSECMLPTCEKCPGVAGVEACLETRISDEADHIGYKQWVSTDYPH